MGQKCIKVGDICRVRHNISGHFFQENDLIVIKKCFPKNSEVPVRFIAATRNECWHIGIEDITLFARNKEVEND